MFFRRLFNGKTFRGESSYGENSEYVGKLVWAHASLKVENRVSVHYTKIKLVNSIQFKYQFSIGRKFQFLDTEKLFAFM